MWLNSSKKYNEWDEATTTIADYTVRYAIPKEVYENYRDSVFPDSGHHNVNYGFSCYLKDEFEFLMIEWASQLGMELQQPEIVQIYLQFKNKEIMHILMEVIKVEKELAMTIWIILTIKKER